MKRLIAGSRGSRLAMIQTKLVADALKFKVEIKKISTRGDKIHDVALAKLEGKGFFTKEIDEALLNNEVDFAVHSFKDIPTELPDGIITAAVPKRESQKDALVGGYKSLDELPLQAKVGTASLRRKSEVLRARPDITLEDLRGNLTTRIRKVSEGMYDAIIVAEAGLKRLGYHDYYSLDPETFIPAACQGALAITVRKDDTEVLDILSKLEDPQARLSCNCERLFLSTLGGGCQIPAGVYTKIDTNAKTFHMLGFISSLNGKRFLRIKDSGSLEERINITKALVRELLDSGGRDIIEEIGRGES